MAGDSGFIPDPPTSASGFIPDPAPVAKASAAPSGFIPDPVQTHSAAANGFIPDPAPRAQSAAAPSGFIPDPPTSPAQPPGMSLNDLTKQPVTAPTESTAINLPPQNTDSSRMPPEMRADLAGVQNNSADVHPLQGNAPPEPPATPLYTTARNLLGSIPKAGADIERYIETAGTNPDIARSNMLDNGPDLPGSAPPPTPQQIQMADAVHNALASPEGQNWRKQDLSQEPATRVPMKSDVRIPGTSIAPGNFAGGVDRAMPPSAWEQNTFLGRATAGITGFAPQLALGPALPISMFLQMAGSKLKELEDRGVDPDKALAAATTNSGVKTAIFTALSPLAKAVGARSADELIQAATPFVRRYLTQIGESATAGLGMSATDAVTNKVMTGDPLLSKKNATDALEQSSQLAIMSAAHAPINEAFAPKVVDPASLPQGSVIVHSAKAADGGAVHLVQTPDGKQVIVKVAGSAPVSSKTPEPLNQPTPVEAKLNVENAAQPAPTVENQGGNSTSTEESKFSPPANQGFIPPEAREGATPAPNPNLSESSDKLGQGQQPAQTTTTPPVTVTSPPGGKQGAQTDRTALIEAARARHQAQSGASAQQSGTIPTEESNGISAQGRSGSGADGGAGQGVSSPGAALPQPPRLQGAAGNDAKIHLSDTDSRPVQYQAVEAGDLIPSHDARKNFAINPLGDKNERPYHDPVQGQSSRVNVTKWAANPKPELLLSDNPTMVDGPPLATERGVVLGGNARTQAMQLAYSRGGQPADTIRNATIASAEKFGIDPQAVRGMKNPVIVRVIDDAHAGKPGELSAILNRSLTTGKTSAVEAASRANKASAATLDRISGYLSHTDDTGNNPSLREVLGDPDKAADILKRLVRDGALGTDEIDKLTDPRSGAINEEGKSAIERMLLGRVVGDPTVLGAMTPGSRQRTLAAVAPLTRAIADPTQGPHVRDVLSKALEAYPEYKASGLTVKDFFFDQQTMTPPPGYKDREVASIVHGLDTLGPRQFKQAAADMLDRMGIAQPDENGGQLSLVPRERPARSDDPIVQSFAVAPDNDGKPTAKFSVHGLFGPTGEHEQSPLFGARQESAPSAAPKGDLSGIKRAELVKLAKSEGVRATGGSEQIAEAIRRKRGGAPGGEPSGAAPRPSIAEATTNELKALAAKYGISPDAPRASLVNDLLGLEHEMRRQGAMGKDESLLDEARGARFSIRDLFNQDIGHEQPGLFGRSGKTPEGGTGQAAEAARPPEAEKVTQNPPASDVQTLLRQRKRLQIALDAMPRPDAPAYSAARRAYEARAEPLRQQIKALDEQIGPRPEFFKPRPQTAADRRIARQYKSEGTGTMYSAGSGEPPRGTIPGDESRPQANRPADQEVRQTPEEESRDRAVAESIKQQLRQQFRIRTSHFEWVPDAGQRGPDERLPDTGAMEALSRALGTKLRFFRADPIVHGFHDNGAIAVNLDSPVAHLAIFGHEFGHEIERQAPELHRAMVDAVRALATDQFNAAVGQKRSGYGTRAQKETEVVHDTLGDHFMKKDFWGEVAANMGQSKWRQLRTKLVNFATRLISKLSGKGYQDSPIYSDLVQVRKILAQTTADFIKQRQARGEAPPQFSIAAWHGSPHDFDKFDSSKIGTGEGAQVYGHGLYFAGKRDVAEYYKDKLGGANSIPGEDLKDYFKPGNIVPSYAGQDRVEKFNPTTADRGWSAQVHAVDQNGNRLPGVEGQSRVHSTEPSRGNFKSVVGREAKGGTLYQAELAPEDHELLDWDKPLSQQSEYVKQALEKAGISTAPYDGFKVEQRGNKFTVVGNHGEYGTYATHEEAAKRYEQLSQTHSKSGELTYRNIAHDIQAKSMQGDGPHTPIVEAKKQASDYLHSLGIRGIKYADEQSRSTKSVSQTSQGKWVVDGEWKTPYNTRKEALAAAEAGAGKTHNYVIFNDKDVAIKGKFSMGDRSQEDEPREKAIGELTNLREARGTDQARQVVRSEFLNKPLTNFDTGTQATVSRNALDKMLSESGTKDSASLEAHAKAVANLDKLFAAAIHRESRADRNQSPGISAIHHFEAPMPFDGQVLKVKMLVKEYAQTDQGRRVYHINAVEIEKPASSGRSQSELAPKSISNPPAGFSSKFNDLLARVQANVGRGTKFSVAAGEEPHPDDVNLGRCYIQDGVKDFDTFARQFKADVPEIHDSELRPIWQAAQRAENGGGDNGRTEKATPEKTNGNAANAVAAKAEPTRNPAPAEKVAERASGEEQIPPKAPTEGEHKQIRGGAGDLARAVGFDQAKGDTKQGDVFGSLKDRLTAAAQHVADSAKRMSGNLFPSITRRAASSGEAMARWIAARVYAKEAAPVAAKQILGEEGAADPKLDTIVGTILAQDNLDSIRRGFVDEARNAKDPDERQAALENAARVKDIIGSEGSPIQTQTQYEQLLKDPKVQSVIERYKQWFAGEPDRNFRIAQDIAPDEELPSRGEATGARVNLRAITPDEAQPKSVVYTARRGNLNNPAVKRSPFARQAFGTGGAYDVSLKSMIENTLAKGTEIARQREAYDQLVKDGLAVYGSAKSQPTIDGKPTVPFDIKKTTLITKDGQTVPLNKKLFVRSDIAGEFRRAAAVDAPVRSKALAMIANLANRTALASSVEATYHLRNQLVAAIKSPGVGAVIPDLVATSANLIKGDPSTMARLAEIGRIGALRERSEPLSGLSKVNPLAWGSKLVEASDRVGRLMMDKAFTRLASKGLYKDTETNRRDFINQLGQYNIRGQHTLVALSRDLGTGPFATAGTNFYAMGAKSLALDPGAKATSLSAAVNLRARVAARYLSVIGAVALTNYLQTGRVDGGKDVPFGAIVLGHRKDGSVRYFDALGTFTPLLRGARELGLKAAGDYLRGKTTGKQAIDSAAQDIAGSAVQPFAGPLVNDIAIAATGHSASGFDEAERAKPNEPKALENLRAAARNLNPTIGSLLSKSGAASKGIFGPFGFGTTGGQKAKRQRAKGQ